MIHTRLLNCGFILLFCFEGLLLSQILQENLGLTNKQIMSVGIYDNVLAVGTLKQGVYWQPLGSATNTSWQLIGLDSAEVYSVYPHKSGPLGWAIGAGLKPDSFYPHYVYCSFLGGTFEAKDTGISDSLAVIIHELDGFPDPSICGETFAAAGDAVFRRNFGDSLWVPVYSATVEGYILTVKAHEEFPGVVLAGGSEGFAGQVILKSLDFGDSWEWLSPPGMVQSLDFSGDSAQTIFAVTLQGLFRSLDAGLSWNPIYQNSTYPPEHVIFNQTSSRLFVSGYFDPGSGIAPLLYSNDLGDTWQNIPATFRNTITDLKLDVNENIYIATFDSGLYRLDPAILDISLSDDESTIRSFDLQQNFPNPFNAGTIIRYTLKTLSSVDLDIYTLLGDKVKSYQVERQPAGEYYIHWDGRENSGRKVSSGFYFYVLKAAGQAQIRKMLLLR
jgi:hypothetical protein